MVQYVIFLMFLWSHLYILLIEEPIAWQGKHLLIVDLLLNTVCTNFRKFMFSPFRKCIQGQCNFVFAYSIYTANAQPETEPEEFQQKTEFDQAKEVHGLYIYIGCVG